MEKDQKCSPLGEKFYLKIKFLVKNKSLLTLEKFTDFFAKFPDFS